MTAAELTFITVTGYYYNLESPATSGVTNAAQFNGLTGGYITFTPRLPTGFVIEIAGLDLGSGNTGSTALSVAPITGRVMGTVVNGSPVWELCTINASDTPGIQLLANSSVISTYLTAQGIASGQLIYDVTFTQVTFAGNQQSITPFAFVAPTSAETVCITDPTFVKL